MLDVLRKVDCVSSPTYQSKIKHGVIHGHGFEPQQSRTLAAFEVPDGSVVKMSVSGT